MPGQIDGPSYDERKRRERERREQSSNRIPIEDNSEYEINTDFIHKWDKYGVNDC